MRYKWGLIKNSFVSGAVIEWLWFPRGFSVIHRIQSETGHCNYTQALMSVPDRVSVVKMWCWAAEVHFKVSARIQRETQCIVGSGGKQMVCAVAERDDDRPLRDSSGSERIYRTTRCSPASPAARRRRHTSACFHLMHTHAHLFIDTVFFLPALLCFTTVCKHTRQCGFCQDFGFSDAELLTMMLACFTKFWCINVVLPLEWIPNKPNFYTNEV